MAEVSTKIQFVVAYKASHGTHRAGLNHLNLWIPWCEGTSIYLLYHCIETI